MEHAEGYERRWWILGVLCLSLLVIGLDNTILNVALPTLVARPPRHRPASCSGWSTPTSLVFAGLLLTAGSLGDRFGRRDALADRARRLRHRVACSSAFAGSASS